MNQPTPQFNQVETVIKERQNNICNALKTVDNTPYKEDCWQRPGGGGGVTRIFETPVFEKAGVNSSCVFGTIDPEETPLFNQLIAKASPSTHITKNSFFYATGLSLVIHPRNPHIPTVHANYRYFEVTNANQQTVWWFGGGADLTPYYLNKTDAMHFHGVLQKTCNQYQANAYNEFKKNCDAYFYLPHRQETRGIGGIFFDYLNHSFDDLFEFISLASSTFIDAYLPIVYRNKDTPVLDHHRHWQCIRRGRYAEFNLLYDRGTLFGLKTNGRIESILMSMPPEAKWVYDFTPDKNSEEAKLIHVLKNPQSWT